MWQRGSPHLPASLPMSYTPDGPLCRWPVVEAWLISSLHFYAPVFPLFACSSLPLTRNIAFPGILYWWETNVSWLIKFGYCCKVWILSCCKECWPSGCEWCIYIKNTSLILRSLNGMLNSFTKLVKICLNKNGNSVRNSGKKYIQPEK